MTVLLYILVILAIVCLLIWLLPCFMPVIVFGLSFVVFLGELVSYSVDDNSRVRQS